MNERYSSLDGMRTFAAIGIAIMHILANIDITPDYLSDELLLNSEFDNIDALYNRGSEIKGWLMLHGDDVSHYAIIDDMDEILPEQQNHFVQADPDVGITKFDADCIIRLLNN